MINQTSKNLKNFHFNNLTQFVSIKLYLELSICLLCAPCAQMFNLAFFIFFLYLANREHRLCCINILKCLNHIWSWYWKTQWQMMSYRRKWIEIWIISVYPNIQIDLSIWLCKFIINNALRFQFLKKNWKILVSALLRFFFFLLLIEHYISYRIASHCIVCAVLKICHNFNENRFLSNIFWKKEEKKTVYVNNLQYHRLKML